MTATTLAALIVIAAVALAVPMAIVRVVRGPTAIDRIVALDILSASSLALCIASSLLVQRMVFIDVGLGLAMVGFVATLAWSRLVRYKAPAPLKSSTPSASAMPASARHEGEAP
ncbi:MAG: monovalent cation/H+ antiporter complex subunit F [Brachymonas sp.]|nr:monovalent cation/H+ antiporter complex subunit F [Brachymonas sp.]